jgi:hypothetical protein
MGLVVGLGWGWISSLAGMLGYRVQDNKTMIKENPRQKNHVRDLMKQTLLPHSLSMDSNSYFAL